uniref:Reverse transcriptase domain-containing protein n=1 Tax=Oryza brachyantha TaxID=4533 RepID=J3M5L5_ORYBR
MAGGRGQAGHNGAIAAGGCRSNIDDILPPHNPRLSGDAMAGTKDGLCSESPLSPKSPSYRMSGPKKESYKGKAPAASTKNQRGEAEKLGPAEDDDDDLNFQEAEHTIATMDGGPCAHASRRSFKAMKRELLATVLTHKTARWSRWLGVPLTFDHTDHPASVADSGHLALVTSPTIYNVKVGRVLIDGVAALNLLSPKAFDTLKAPGMSLKPSLPIIGVTPGLVWPLGQILLPITFGGPTNFRTEQIDFNVADLSLPYNAMLGKPVLVKFMALAHYAYRQLKMSGLVAPSRCMATLRWCWREQKCASTPSLWSPPPRQPARAPRRQPCEPPRSRLPRPTRYPSSLSSLAMTRPRSPISVEGVLVSFLRANTDVFAWKPSDMPGVPREVIEHCLAVRPDTRPVRQKEVARFLEASFIREVVHPEWLANPVVVPKANDKMRMCIDYIDLNKACPRDPFPLARIDQIVDSTAGCDLLCFLDAYLGYHQIGMARKDEEKIAFITPVGTYCYVSMPFGLKNVGTTFQRSTRITLSSQIGRNVEACVDDLVVKTRNREALLSDLDETFDSLRTMCMKLNPEKCVFEVPTGKLLGFLVCSQGIKANHEKIKAIQRMRPPRMLRDV